VPPDTESLTKPRGLLASGACRDWEVAVDESLERDEWSLEIEGPRAYLFFRLQGLGKVRDALLFLQAHLEATGCEERTKEDALLLGRFGSASVSLLWDNEDFKRCFLLIGSKARSTVRFTLEEDDLKQIIEALGQVVSELPQASSN
jgi:hypothetical protein